MIECTIIKCQMKKSHTNSKMLACMDWPGNHSVFITRCMKFQQAFMLSLLDCENAEN